MDAERENLVVGLFESHQRADVALETLHRIGVPDADIEIGTPEPGRYRIERHESAQLWTGVRNGIVGGAVVGSVISLGIMSWVVPGLSIVNLLELSVPMGAAWGMFFGGLTGMALRSMILADGEPRYAVTDDSHDVLMIVHAGDHPVTVHAALERQHPHHFLTDVPAVHHTRPHPVPTV